MFIEGIDRQNVPSYLYSYVSWFTTTSILWGNFTVNRIQFIRWRGGYCHLLYLPCHSGVRSPFFRPEPQAVATSHCTEEFYMLYPNSLALVVQVVRSQLLYISLLFFLHNFLCLWSSPVAFSDDHFLVINPKRDSVQIKFFIKKRSGKLSTLLSLLSISIFLSFSPLFPTGWIFLFC